MPIDREKYVLNTQILEDVELFDTALDVCEDLAEQTMHRNPSSLDEFSQILIRHRNKNGLPAQVFESFYEIYKGFKTVKEKDRDGIWKFIVQNLYKPYFLANQFAHVIGNPPWFTFSSVQNEKYQKVLNDLATTYNIKPEKVADFPHLEIAAIFLGYCTNYFLKEGGKLAFVLPRSFFSGSQHDNTRSGKAIGVKLSAIWDLQDVAPLFRIPSCVMFSEPNEGKRALPASGLAGITFEGHVPSHNCNYEEAKPKLIETRVKWFYSKQGDATAFSLRKQKKQRRKILTRKVSNKEPLLCRVCSILSNWHKMCPLILKTVPLYSKQQIPSSRMPKRRGKRSLYIEEWRVDTFSERRYREAFCLLRCINPI